MVAIVSQRSKKSKSTLVVATGIVACLVLSLSACGNKEKAAAGQSLVRVDGSEITVHQLNDELARTNVAADKKDEATKQILEMLINQRLLIDAATKDKLDRDPSVMAAIERARAQILAQAVMQKRLAAVARPTKDEIDKYYADHPDLFANRRQFTMDQLAISTKDFNEDAKAMLVPSKTLDDLAAWFKAHQIEFVRSSSSASSVDLPEQLLKKITEMQKGQVFALQQSDKTMILSVRSVKADPAKTEAADPQIAKFLQDQHSKEASNAEITRLRATAKIEYLNKAEPAKAATAPATPGKQDTAADHIKKGVADL